MFREKLLKEIQGHIPLVKRPFLEIAKRLDVKEEEVLGELRKLKEERVVRQVSPIFDTKSAGYDSSLVAFKVPSSRIELVANLVNSHPGVSHNYERRHEFNLWFTLAVPPDSKLGLEGTVELMAELSDVKDYAILRTLRTFKIGVKLDYGELREKEEVIGTRTGGKTELSDTERRVIRVAQRDIPLISRPFRAISEELGMEEEEVLDVLIKLKEKGVMRRFSAILFHRRIGFKANGMAVWSVPEDRVEEVGLYLASFKSVSHCYERTTSERWRYNLFSMIHGRTEKEVVEFVKGVGEELRIEKRDVLFSTREFKKRRVELFSEEFYEWEERNGRVPAH